MQGYLKALLDEDVYYDEENPKYRCCSSHFHVLTVTKFFFVVHIFLILGFLASYFPYSFVTLPVLGAVVVSTVHALLTNTSLTLLPFYVYVVALIVFNCCVAVSAFILSIVNSQHLLELLGYPNLQDLVQKIVLIFVFKLFMLFCITALWWQVTVIYRCRQYFEDKEEQQNYAHLSVPESFLDSNIGAHLPTKCKLNVPDYVLYTLDGEESDQDSEKIEGKKQNLEEAVELKL